MALAHARSNILRLSKGILFDESSTSPFAYVTTTIMREASAKLGIFQQCSNDVSDLAYVTGYVPHMLAL